MTGDRAAGGRVAGGQGSAERATGEPAARGGRIMGLDVGTRRIGVALADPSETIARPLTVIPRPGRRRALDGVRALVREHGVGRIVVGLPLRMDGREGDAAREARRFAEALRVLGVPVVLQDERLSTAEAERTMLAQDARRDERRRRRDAVAAALFLQTYLDRQHRGGKTE